MTCADFFARPKMEYWGSALIVLWDEDGEEGDSDEFRSSESTPGVATPEFTKSVLGDVYTDMNETAIDLIEAGPSNPGGN